MSGRRITGYGGLAGVVRGDLGAAGTDVEVVLDGGTRILVPRDAITTDAGGALFVPISMADVERAFAQRFGEERVVVPVIEERLEVGKRVVETGRVRIQKRVVERTEQIDQPLMREHVEIERVRLDQWVDGPVEVRNEGDTLVIPVLEEVLVVQKRMVLREEIRVRKWSVPQENAPTTATVRREEFEIERLDPTGEPSANRR